MFRAIIIRPFKNPLRNGFFAAMIIVAGLAGAIYAFSMLYPLAHTDVINKYAEEYGLEPALVCAVIHAESRFRKDALSPKGANGLMQLTEPTAMWLAEKMDITGFEPSQVFDPEINIRIGCYNLSRLLKKYNGDITLALSAYNAGEGNVKRWQENPAYSDDGVTLTHIPFPETKEYIKRVTFNIKIYRIMLKVMGGEHGT